MSHHVPVAPIPGRCIPAHQLDEKAMLWAFLRFARATVIAKTEGMSAEQLTRQHVGSATTLGGILSHLACVEYDWFANRLGGDNVSMPFGPEEPDGDWHTGDTGRADLVARYHAACATSDEVIAALDLDSTGAQTDSDYTLRWAMTHLVAETHRHAGHADLLRELTDGARGW